MKISHKEMIAIRIKLLKEMNQYIINLGDEELWIEWITVAVPDEPSEEDYEFIASSENEWKDVCRTFGILVKWDKEHNY